MTRLDLLQILVGQARSNGFDFRYWYLACIRLPWEGQIPALQILADQRRYYALLFHHDFAKAFWKAGETITFQVPASTFERTMADGTTRIVERKPFMRRSARADAWRYHLSQMALAEEPLRYMRKYLHVEEDIVDDAPIAIAAAAQPRPPVPATLALARKAALKRERAVAALPPMPVKKESKRSPRLPGSR